VALVATLPPGAVAGLGHHLLVDRAADGWWYALATAGLTTVAYCTDADQIGRGRAGVSRIWRAACAMTPWFPPDATAVRPVVRSRPLGRGPAPADPCVQVVGDAALTVDWLSGNGLALAVEAGVRSAGPAGCADWYDDVAGAHAAQRRDVYRAAGADAPFWNRRMAHPEVEPAASGVRR
jgi:hypothetical protein